MCECYTIGGPWIAEDPDCPAHGAGGLQEQLDDRDEQIAGMEIRTELMSSLISDLEQQVRDLKAEIEAQRQYGYI